MKRVKTIIYPEAWRSQKSVARQDATENQVATIVQQEGGRVYTVRLRVNANGAISLVTTHPETGEAIDLYRGNVASVFDAEEGRDR
jgi:hypothetical protein